MTPTATDLVRRAARTDAEPGALFFKHCHDVLFNKAATPAITTTDDYGSQVTPGQAQAIGLIRARTLLGQLNLRRVPFRVPVVRQTGNGLFGWRGEGGAAVVWANESEKLTLRPLSATGIVVLTREAIEAGRAEEDLRRELLDGLVAFHDSQFIDPSATGTPDVAPASITSDVTPIPSSGDAATDMRLLVEAFQDTLNTLSNVAFVMSELVAFQIATTAPGSFPQGVAGGLYGVVPVKLSGAAGTNIVGIHQPSILVAEAGIGVEDAAHATLQMRDDPQSGAQQLVSLWQTGSNALRVLRRLLYVVARDGAVQLLTGAVYGSDS